MSRLLAKVLAPFFVICLRFSRYSCLHSFTLKNYRDVYTRSLGRNLIWLQIEGIFLAFLSLIFSWIPEGAIAIFKKAIANIIYYFMPSYRKVIETNLEIAFKGQYSLEEREKITRRSLLHSLDSLFWLMEIPKLNRDKIFGEAQVKGYHYLEAALKKGKGVILAAPHYSRFLFPAFYTGLGSGSPVNFIIRRIDNPFFWEMACLALKYLSLEVIVRNHWALKKGRDALKRGELLFLLMDQNVAVGGKFVPFFDVPASTFRGAHYLVQRTGATILCCHARYHHGVYEVEYFPEIVSDDLKDEEALLKKINGYFEESIRRDPEKHLWMHPRWKKRPPGEASLYPRVKKLSQL